MSLPRGFEFSEVMGGTYALRSAPDDHRRMVFSIHVVADSALRHLRDGKMAMTGTLEMDGFADDVPVAGTLTMLPFTKRLIRYEFTFTGNDGQPYRFAGQKDIRFRDLRRSFTTLPGAVYDAQGREIATALTRFDLRADLFQFVASWRPA
jgi:hypothetical protein